MMVGARDTACAHLIPASGACSEKGFAAATRIGPKFNIHVLANQITALQHCRQTGPSCVAALSGDDDKYLNERTCPPLFEHLEIQESGTAIVSCGNWTPKFSMGV
jgi:hypothetical protein